MRQFTQFVLGLAAIVWIAGCRTATRITDVPRVDLELSGGNRGYLMGSPSAEPELKTTRQMVETTIELPSFYKPKRSGTPVSLDDIAPPERDTDETQAGVSATGEPGGSRDKK